MTFISIGVHLYRTRKIARKESLVEIVAIYTLGLSGWFGIMSGLFGHIIYADEVAASIGWQINSGFQMELGFASIGIGMIGFWGFWSKPIWLPFILARTTLIWGAALTHILHIVEYQNFSPGNAGVILYRDIILPIILIVLYILYRREKKYEYQI